MSLLPFTHTLCPRRRPWLKAHQRAGSFQRTHRRREAALSVPGLKRSRERSRNRKAWRCTTLRPRWSASSTHSPLSLSAASPANTASASSPRRTTDPSEQKACLSILAHAPLPVMWAGLVGKVVKRPGRLVSRAEHHWRPVLQWGVQSSFKWRWACRKVQSTPKVHIPLSTPATEVRGTWPAKRHRSLRTLRTEPVWLTPRGLAACLPARSSRPRPPQLPAWQPREVGGRRANSSRHLLSSLLSHSSPGTQAHSDLGRLRLQVSVSHCLDPYNCVYMHAVGDLLQVADCVGMSINSEGFRSKVVP